MFKIFLAILIFLASAYQFSPEVVAPIYSSFTLLSIGFFFFYIMERIILKAIADSNNKERAYYKSVKSFFTTYSIIIVFTAITGIASTSLIEIGVALFILYRTYQPDSPVKFLKDDK